MKMINRSFWLVALVLHVGAFVDFPNARYNPQTSAR